MEPKSNLASAMAWEMLVAGLRAFHAGDLDEALANFADEVVVKLIGGLPGDPDTYKGKAEVRAWFQGLLEQHFEIREELIEAEGQTLRVKAWSWSDGTRLLGVAPLEATEVYVFQNGKIASMTWAIAPESEAKLHAALAQLTPPA